jgi:Phytanoyl-CoA dioxygenase (PhyH)
MITIDFRSGNAGGEAPSSPGRFLDDQAAGLLDANGEQAGHAARRLGLLPLTLDVQGEQLTFRPGAGSLIIGPGADGMLVAAMDRSAFSDLIADRASAFGLHMTGRAAIQRGSLAAFTEWEPVLRCLLQGRPVYEPGTITLLAADGSPLDLRRSFTLGDDRAEAGHFLAQAGYLHIRGAFTEAEMARVSGELDDAIAAARRDDGASWWARTDPGGWYPARILGFNQKSPALRELMRSDRLTVIGTLTGDRFLQRDPDAGDSAEGLLKKIGVVEGASDVSWHKDCAMGGHSRICCGLIVGISVTAAGSHNGELGVVAGSHRANVAALGIDGLDLPRIPLPTRAGDVTVHCSCTLHMSRPPVSAERRVVYTGFNLAPRPGDVPEAEHADARRERAALGDHVIARQHEGNGSSRLASHEL